jgi:hypothetical protein
MFGDMANALSDVSSSIRDAKDNVDIFSESLEDSTETVETNTVARTVGTERFEGTYDAHGATVLGDSGVVMR